MKEQWGEAEDRDGIRLSWNVFPSSRMVGSFYLDRLFIHANLIKGSLSPCRADWSFVHTFEGEARYATLAVRADNLQASLQGCSQPILVCVYSKYWNFSLT